MFWQRYVELCNSKGEAPNVVAAKVGVKSSGTVTGWKNGALPRVSVLTKLADYFEVQMSELTGEEQKEKPTLEAEGGPKYAPGYELLTPENRAKADSYLAFLLAEQQNGQT